jgi:tripartite-type tricarboxylate transporter receptor subunit TctC
MRKGSQTMRLVCAVVLLLSVFIPHILLAQEYPNKPVILVIPMPPGGTHDLTARAVTSVAADYLGQPMLIKLMPGGGGAIGTDFVEKAKPDGYTLLMTGPGWNSQLPAFEGRSRGPEYFEPICRINYNAQIMVANPSMPFKTYKEMMAWIKANPGKLIVGVGGQWAWDAILWKQLIRKTGISVKLVPFDGGGPQLLALLGGHTNVGGAAPSMYMPYKNSGKLVPLVYLDKERYRELPDVPTSVEEGFNLFGQMWRGVAAPKGTPHPIIEKLGQAFKKMSEDKSVVSMIKQLGDDIQFLGPDEYAKYWYDEYESYKDLAKAIK